MKCFFVICSIDDLSILKYEGVLFWLESLELWAHNLKKYECASKACNSVSSNIMKRTIIYYLAKHATMGNIQKDKLYE